MSQQRLQIMYPIPFAFNLLMSLPFKETKYNNPAIKNTIDDYSNYCVKNATNVNISNNGFDVCYISGLDSNLNTSSTMVIEDITNELNEADKQKKRQQRQRQKLKQQQLKNNPNLPDLIPESAWEQIEETPIKL